MELLDKVKLSLGIGGTAHDSALQVYIDEVKEYMLSAGVSEETVNSDRAHGVICKGVADLWTYNAGLTTLSNYFKERVIQLSLHK